MKRIICILFFPLLLSFQSPKKARQVYQDERIRCTYETVQKRKDGKYLSCYPNGKKKAQGRFENNYRSGLWSVWDSTGRLRMQREYTDPFTFTRSFPKMPAEAPVQLLGGQLYAIRYNADGFISQSYLKESAVLWAKRVWRNLLPEENPLLFNNDLLLGLLEKGIHDSTLQAYREEEFWNKIFPASTGSARQRIIAFKLKEDSFFDSERLVSETRIIGICPVALNLDTRDTTDLYWIYFPAMRKLMAQVRPDRKVLPEKIKTLDDLFFFRYFFGEIYKETNIQDKPIKSYKTGKDIAREAERIELEIIESEHDIWINFTK